MTEPKRTQLGWANSDPSFFKRLNECKLARHTTGERNLDPSNHGYDRLFWCDTCGYEFHVDSSG